MQVRLCGADGIYGTLILLGFLFQVLATRVKRLA